MKVTDIQACDWVQCYIDSNEVKPAMVIDFHYNEYAKYKGYYAMVGAPDYVNNTITPACNVFDVNILPLPITEKILEANGFIDNGMALLYDFSEGNILKEGYVCNQVVMVKWAGKGRLKIFRCGIVLKGVANVNIEIKYVHELQHALRLCGLNDLADNFKLKADE